MIKAIDEIAQRTGMGNGGEMVAAKLEMLYYQIFRRVDIIKL